MIELLEDARGRGVDDSQRIETLVLFSSDPSSVRGKLTAPHALPIAAVVANDTEVLRPRREGPYTCITFAASSRISARLNASSEDTSLSGWLSTFPCGATAASGSTPMMSGMTEATISLSRP